MGDDQWPAPPKRGNGEREQRPRGGNSGPLPGQGQGGTRPPNSTGQYTSGRPAGNPNTAGPGQSAYNNAGAGRTQGPWRDDSWGQSDRSGAPQRRGPSGPINSAGRGGSSYPASPGGDPRRRSGGLGGQEQGGRGSWDAEEERWPGGGTTRNSRNLSAPLGRPGQGSQTGRGQSGQWGTNARGWDNAEEDDTGWGMRNRQQRQPSSPLTTGGRGGQGTMSKPPRNQNQDRSGGARRGDWMIEETKSRSPNQTLRTRLLLALLAVVVVLGAAVVLVPSVRNRLRAYLPGGSSNSNGPAAATAAALIVQVNVPTATVSLDSQAAQKTTAGQAPFSSATFSAVTAGTHKLTIQATNYGDATGSITMGASDTTVTAWLAPTQDALNTLLQQLGTPTPQPDAGVAGDQYASGKKATGKLTIGVKYTLSGLTPTSFASQIASGADTTTSPFQPVKLSLVPVVTFTSAAGTTLATDAPTSQVNVQVTLGADGKLQFASAPTALLNSNVTAKFPNPAGQDFLLYYTLAAMIPAPASALTVTCVGAKDTTNFNPEDGLFLSVTTSAGAAHFFYRWGLLWATNNAALTLAPKALHAVFGTNEFSAATNIEMAANPSCGSGG